MNGSLFFTFIFIIIIQLLTAIIFYFYFLTFKCNYNSASFLLLQFKLKNWNLKVSLKSILNGTQPFYTNNYCKQDRTWRMKGLHKEYWRRQWSYQWWGQHQSWEGTEWQWQHWWDLGMVMMGDVYDENQLQQWQCGWF